MIQAGTSPDFIPGKACNQILKIGIEIIGVLDGTVDPFIAQHVAAILHAAFKIMVYRIEAHLVPLLLLLDEFSGNCKACCAACSCCNCRVASACAGAEAATGSNNCSKAARSILPARRGSLSCAAATASAR